MEVHECKCDAAGSSICPVFLRMMTSRDKQICRGDSIPSHRRDAYLTKWYAAVNRNLPLVSSDSSSFVPNTRRGLGDTVKRGIARVSGGLIKQCSGCKNRQASLNQRLKSATPPLTSQPIDVDSSVRHLFLHVYPLERPRDWVWKRWLQRVIENHHIWNGRKVVCVVTSVLRDEHVTALSEFDTYREQLTDLGFEISVQVNNKGMREGAYFIQHLDNIKTNSPNEVICNLHCKGVTHGNSPSSVAHAWGDAMWETVIANWREAIQALNGHGCSGSFKRYGSFNTSGNNKWHYSGSFYWLRSLDLFQRNWEYIDKSFFGIESYVGSHFLREEGACLFMDNTQDLYQQNYWDSDVVPALDHWRLRNSARSSHTRATR